MHIITTIKNHDVLFNFTQIHMLKMTYFPLNNVQTHRRPALLPTSYASGRRGREGMARDPLCLSDLGHEITLQITFEKY